MNRGIGFGIGITYISDKGFTTCYDTLWGRGVSGGALQNTLRIVPKTLQEERVHGGEGVKIGQISMT